MNILLIGTGYMAKEYAKVLKALNISFDAVGRSVQNCHSFESIYIGTKVFQGGLEKMKDFSHYSHAIVCSNVDYLSTHTKLLVRNGIQKILLEKPGGSSIDNIEALISYLQFLQVEVYLGYNRRFYSSVLAALELIKEDERVLSFNFEFTEWPHTIESIPNFEVGRKNLLITNSSHVIDMAFFIGGSPKQMQCFTSDSIEWHNPAIFAGSGVSIRGALFSYQANWRGPGRWAVEIVTKNRRLIFRPLEQLHVQQQRSVKIEPVPIDDHLDLIYKPGLYRQIRAFLYGENKQYLLSLSDFQDNLKYYRAILLGENYYDNL